MAIQYTKIYPLAVACGKKNAKGHPVVGYSTLPFTYIDANLCKRKIHKSLLSSSRTLAKLCKKNATYTPKSTVR